MKRTLSRRLQDHPRLLEFAHAGMERTVRRCAPLLRRVDRARLDRWLRGLEAFGKRRVFDCRMCGQCILHETGMTCPMTCPKNLRNGPCGGVTLDGGCEVRPDTRCVWVDAWERSRAMRRHRSAFDVVQPPLDRRLEGSSAWLQVIHEEDAVATPGWPQAHSGTGGDA